MDMNSLKQIFKENNIGYVEGEKVIQLAGGMKGVIAEEYCDRAVTFNFDDDGKLLDVNLLQ